MRKVILDITVSLDGFSAGPNITPILPMGENGIRLHDWIFGLKSDQDSKILSETVENSGAVIVGGSTYHIAIDGAWGGETPFSVPAFVLTTNVPLHGKSGFTFVTDGIERALMLARAAAGEKNVWVMGGANIIQQYLKTGLFDELHLHIAPLLLGNGTRLFEQNGNDLIELENIETIKTAGATHFKFRQTQSQQKNSNK
jgi:dihydrofolate reductase